MQEHPSWFVGQGLSVDAAGTVEPFSLQDLKKTNAMNYLLELCKNAPINEWVGRWQTAFDAIEEALSMKLSDMMRASVPSVEQRVEEISPT